MKGFLGARGDLLSDLLVTGLAGILPALMAATFFAAKKRFVLHRAVMTAIFSILLLYVILFGTTLIAEGSFRFNTRVSEGLYFIFLMSHLALSAFTVLFGGLTLAKRGISPSARYLPSCRHRIVFAEMGLLVFSVFTGLSLYYLTFIY